MSGVSCFLSLAVPIQKQKVQQKYESKSLRGGNLDHNSIPLDDSKMILTIFNFGLDDLWINIGPNQEAVDFQVDVFSLYQHIQTARREVSFRQQPAPDILTLIYPCQCKANPETWKQMSHLRRCCGDGFCCTAKNNIEESEQ